MADDVAIRDANGALVVIGANDASGVFYTRHVQVDSTGAFESPCGDSQARAINVIVGNGTQTMPSADVAARKLFAAITDGTNTLAVLAEDAAHSSGDKGLMSLGVRQDTPGNLSGTDGDYEPFQVSAGRLWTSTTVTALAPGVAATSLGKAEDAAHTTGDVGVAHLGKRTDTPACSAGTDGDYATINQDANGRAWGRALDDGPAWTSVFGVSGAAFTSADASATAVAVTDAPTGTQKLVITDLVISSAAALTFTFTCETTAVVLLKLYLAAASTVVVQLRGKLKLATADKKLMVQTSGAGAVGVTVGYYSEA